MPDDTMGIVETVIEDIRQVHGARWFDPAAEEFWTVIFHRFAADVIERTMPDDPIVRLQIIAKAQQLGIDMGGQSAGGVPRQDDRRRRSAEIKPFPPRK